MSKKLLYTKYACYAGCAAQAAVICLSPILFMTFHNTYGISYTLLGLLAVFNFCSQLLIDLIFSFFSEHFNIPFTVQVTPIITIVGIVAYAFLPMLVPAHPYAGIVTGTVIYSVAAGLCEVLLSPTIAAIYADDPEREMSKFHSVYAWGVVAVVVISSLFLKVFGTAKWNYLALFWAILPLISALLFAKGEMPPMDNNLAGKNEGSKKKMLGGVLIFVLCIFFGSAAENTITQWCSGYVETVLGFDKFTGDLLGMALFSVLLGLARTLYGKFGKGIYPVMLGSFIGATACYLVAGFSRQPLLGLAACVLCGLFVSMLWPGTIIWTENIYPNCGVVVYALLAAGGDFGAGIAPQLMGAVTDKVAASDWALSTAQTLGMTADQIGLKSAMVISTVFGAAGIILVLVMHNTIDKKKAAQSK